MGDLIKPRSALPTSMSNALPESKSGQAQLAVEQLVAAQDAIIGDLGEEFEYVLDVSGRKCGITILM